MSFISLVFKQLFVLLLLLLMLTTTESQAEPLTTERKSTLIHLLKQDCGSCHGMTLKGGLGPALTVEQMKDKPVEYLQNIILNGRAGTAMPPWKSILTEQEALWISQQLLAGINNE